MDRVMAKVEGKSEAAIKALDSTTKGDEYAALSSAQKRQVIEGLDQELDERLDAALAQCKSILSKYEDKAESLRWWVFGIAVVGALAGGVGVPALVAAAPLANRSAIAALGGISGAANTAQGALERVGLTPDQFLETRKALAANLETAFQDYKQASEETNPKRRFEKMAAAIAQIQVACMTYDIAKTTSNHKGEMVSDFSVTVGSGVTPAYTWLGENAVLLTVTRTSSDVPRWQVTSTSPAGLASPLAHGTVPGGASQLVSSPESALTAGVQYKVSVLRKDNKIGFKIFTP